MSLQVQRRIREPTYSHAHESKHAHTHTHTQTHTHTHTHTRTHTHNPTTSDVLFREVERLDERGCLHLIRVKLVERERLFRRVGALVQGGSLSASGQQLCRPSVHVSAVQLSLPSIPSICTISNTIMVLPKPPDGAHQRTSSLATMKP